jgi:hypothetical protein
LFSSEFTRESGKTMQKQDGDREQSPAAENEAGGQGLRGRDKVGGDLIDENPSRGQPVTGEPGERQRAPHQNAQEGADVRGEPPMVQGADSAPEGLRRERKGPYSPVRGRNENPSHVPGANLLPNPVASERDDVTKDDGPNRSRQT